MLTVILKGNHFMLSDLANVLTSPLVHAPILFAILITFKHFSRHKRLFTSLSFLPVIWLFCCSMTYPSVLLIKPLEDQYPVLSIESQEWQHTDAIVVLACNYFEDDELPFVSKWPNCSLQRNLQAVLLYQTHKMPVYLAGAILGENDRHSQARHNREFLEKFGVNPSDIHTIAKGTNTESEVAALASILNDKRNITLVTSASHLPRAVKYFFDLKFNVIAAPVEHLSNKTVEPSLSMPNATSLYRSERAIHEYLGLIYQRLLI